MRARRARRLPAADAASAGWRHCHRRRRCEAAPASRPAQRGLRCGYSSCDSLPLEPTLRIVSLMLPWRRNVLGFSGGGFCSAAGDKAAESVRSFLDQAQGEGTAPAVLALHNDAPTEERSDLLAQVQAKAGPFLVARRRVAQPGERLDQAGLILGPDPDPAPRPPAPHPPAPSP